MFQLCNNSSICNNGLLWEFVSLKEMKALEANNLFLSCLSPLFESEAKCKAFHMNISFIHVQTLVHLYAARFETEASGNSDSIQYKVLCSAQVQLSPDADGYDVTRGQYRM